MDERIEKLKHMQTQNLIDVVRNYQKHGYSNEIRDSALLILAERGISQEALKLSGKIDNLEYHEAQAQYRKFTTNSFIGLFLYVLSVIVLQDLPLLSMLFYLATLIFVGLSFRNVHKLSKLLNDDSINFSLIFIFLSLIFYFIMFFIVRKEIKDKMIFLN